MSGRSKKKFRDYIAGRVLARKISPEEGRRVLAAAGIPVKGRATGRMAAKSAAPPQRTAAGTDMLHKSRGPGLTAQQRSYLEIYDMHSSPAVREAAYQAAYPGRGTT